MRLFISHGARDAWIARQMARGVIESGATAFLDVFDIVTGDEFETRIRDSLMECDELVVLLTPFSLHRGWVHNEIGAMWLQRKRISAILYGLTFHELAKARDMGVGLLTMRHTRDLNDFDQFLRELEGRLRHGS